MRTDDPVRDYDHYDREQEEWLKSLPICAHCKEHIQDYKFFRIEEVNICFECLYDYCEKHYEVSNTKL